MYVMQDNECAIVGIEVPDEEVSGGDRIGPVILVSRATGKARKGPGPAPTPAQRHQGTVARHSKQPGPWVSVGA